MATHLALLRKRRRLIAKKRSMRPYKLPDELVAGDRPLYGHQMTLERMEFLVPADTISEFGGVIKLVRESELIFSIFPSLNGIFYQLLKAESKHYLLRYDRSFPLTPYVVFEILEPHILANIIDQCKTKEALAGFRIAPCAEYAWMLEPHIPTEPASSTQRPRKSLANFRMECGFLGGY